MPGGGGGAPGREIGSDILKEIGEGVMRERPSCPGDGLWP